MSGVDEILNYKRSADEDYYAILGCDEHSSVSNNNNNNSFNYLKNLKSCF